MTGDNRMSRDRSSPEHGEKEEKRGEEWERGSNRRPGNDAAVTYARYLSTQIISDWWSLAV
jgi:hypothetical protein